MAYSNNSGGTLTLPSPTHAHHVDVGSAVRSLRRSLSRSPSKFNLAQAASPTETVTLPRGPSPESPCPPHHTNTAASATAVPTSSAFPSATPQSHTPFATPFRSGVKLSLRSARPKVPSSKPTSRPRPPKSPLKRALSITSDAGNTTPNPPSSLDTLFGQENTTFHSLALAFGQSPRVSMEKPSRHSMHLDLSGASKTTPTKFPDVRGDVVPTSTSSPLKRTDAIMDFGQASFGSPVAKRRSLHGISSLGNVVGGSDGGTGSQQHFDIHEDGGREYQLAGGESFGFRDPPASALGGLPKRSSSLRKSTLQQRHDPRSSWGRRQGEKYLAQQSGEAMGLNVRSRPRASLDQFLAPEPRDSPFSNRAPLPNPSAHAMDRPNQPHPLSRSLTNSSSASSIPDESPTHVPVHHEAPRRVPTFGRSLPHGGQRPREPAATPAYKLAQPYQGAFASTGLVSKMNRNPERDPSLAHGEKPPVMPDTPCKKPHVYPSNTYPPSSGSGSGSGGGRKHQRFSIPALPSSEASKTPETPYHGASQHARGTFGTGGVLKLRPTGHTRQSSLLSVDGDSPDGDLPSTPTKPILARNLFSKTQRKTTPAVVTAHAAPTSAIGLGIDIRAPNLSSSPLAEAHKSSPMTPQDAAPPDPSRLSISTSRDVHAAARKTTVLPATPVAERGDPLFGFGDRRVSITPIQAQHAAFEYDAVLSRRFTGVEFLGKGEFSQVFRVTATEAAPSQEFFGWTPGRNAQTSNAQRVYAVKKVRLPVYNERGYQAKLREVAALRAVRGRDNVLQLVNYWEEDYHLYIQTEYCAEGSLDTFLKKFGEHGRLDDFRIWKILVEVCQGLRHIHDAGFIHLDMKPANIFVTSAGHLKIGDFGMATVWPAPRGIEGEGDRTYLSAEALNGEFDKPADVFAVGLIVLEIAANVYLPDNGPTWMALREGDLSMVQTLTAGEAAAPPRDAAGVPIPRDGSPGRDSLASSTSSLFSDRPHDAPTHDAGNLFGTAKRSYLERPPVFMSDQYDAGSLDNLVRWMITRNPKRRPTVHQVLQADSVQWVSTRRSTSATVFEGNWGPGNSTSSVPPPAAEHDTEMTDV